jgi:hypothetical protein
MGRLMNVRALSGRKLAEERGWPRSRTGFEPISVQTFTAKRRGSFARLRAAFPLKTNGFLQENRCEPCQNLSRQTAYFYRP